MPFRAPQSAGPMQPNLPSLPSLAAPSFSPQYASGTVIQNGTNPTPQPTSNSSSGAAFYPNPNVQPALNAHLPSPAATTYGQQQQQQQQQSQRPTAYPQPAVAPYPAQIPNGNLHNYSPHVSFW